MRSPWESPSHHPGGNCGHRTRASDDRLPLRPGRVERTTTMRIERRYTTEGQDAYAEIAFRTATSEIRNPGRLGGVPPRGHRRAGEFWSQVAADILAQKYFRKAGVPARLKKVEETTVPSWLWRSVPTKPRRPICPRTSASARRDRRPPGLRPSRRHLDLLGLEGQAISTSEEDAARLLRRTALHARHADGRAELAAVVQHRPALGLWHRRPRPGPLLCRPLHRQADASASAYEHPQPHACFIQSVERRPRQRERHHGPVGARSAPVQVRLRHRLQLLFACAAKAKSCRAAAARPA
jgi:ribonucleoside-diphosphate reductase alpha chain